MNVMETIATILISALAVLGFYGLLHGLFESLLRPKQLTSAVTVRTEKDAADLDILLCEAKRSPCRRRCRSVVLVISHELMDGRVGEGSTLKEEYALLAEKYGAEICVTLPQAEDV
ncbi:MAG: hypothetical protein E7610_02005 [Ruminococcaceae bacterium]|nr:hypothetical protein [Oscillospiraceae bacterium]